MYITSNDFEERLNMNNIEDFYKASCAALKFLAETEVISLEEIESRYPVFYRQSVNDSNKDEICVKVPTYNVFIRPIEDVKRPGEDIKTAEEIYEKMSKNESLKAYWTDIALDKEDWKRADVKTQPFLCRIKCMKVTFEKNKQCKEEIKEIVNKCGYMPKEMASYYVIPFTIEFLDNDKNNFKIVKEKNNIPFLY